MNALKILENKLIPVYLTDEGEKVVNARELHDYLGVERDFSTWISQRVSDYGFEKGIDFSTFLGESSGGRPPKEYVLSLDMGKELGMVERNRQGRKIRKYFIEVEKRARGIAQNNQSVDGKQFALESTKMLMPLMEELQLSASSKMTAIKSIYEEAGINLPFHVQLPDNLLTCTDIAKRIGVYSNSGNPHHQAIGAIINDLDLKPNEIETTMGSNGSHQYSQEQYYPSVMEKVRGWLTIKGKPERVETERGNYNVQYLK
jgi:phage anti-repressor protein